jgi:hypothetical protein
VSRHVVSNRLKNVSNFILDAVVVQSLIPAVLLRVHVAAALSGADPAPSVTETALYQAVIALGLVVVADPPAI